MFDDFDTGQIPTDGAVMHVRTAGTGPPVLLVHGYPQTHAMWHAMAPRLAERHRVVVVDLRGYGRSRCLDGDYTFRAMARDLGTVMTELGHADFHIVGHDRGARAAHRLLLDEPDRVASIALLDILPTTDMWRLMSRELALSYYHWTFLAQPDGLPQRLIGADPVGFLHAALGGLSGRLEMFDPEALRAYEQAATEPSVVDAWCGDYAAAAGVDIEHDEADRGRRFDPAALLLWGNRGVVGRFADPLAVWRSWLPRITGGPIEAGHFLVEEQPELTFEKISEHLEAAASPS